MNVNRAAEANTGEVSCKQYALERDSASQPKNSAIPKKNVNHSANFSAGAGAGRTVLLMKRTGRGYALRKISIARRLTRPNAESRN